MDQKFKRVLTHSSLPDQDPRPYRQRDPLAAMAVRQRQRAHGKQSGFRSAGGTALHAAGAIRMGTPDVQQRSPGQQQQDEEWRVFSANPDKAWAEKWFLAYSPVWPALFVLWSTSGKHLEVGDVGNLAVTLLIALPNILVPAVWCPSPQAWWDTYWFKFSVWIWNFTFVASYFFTEYFFDVLGMVYKFPHLEWTLDSRLVGSGKQVVPLMMYFHAWYFFVTYHTVSVIFIRMVRTAPVVRTSRLAKALAVFFSSWLFAWGEIYATTMEQIEEQFTYRDMDWALTWGALCYACYFIPSFPMVFQLDEDPKERWSLQRVVESSLAAGMVAFALLDFVTQYVITGWEGRGF